MPLDMVQAGAVSAQIAQGRAFWSGQILEMHSQWFNGDIHRAARGSWWLTVTSNLCRLPKMTFESKTGLNKMKSRPNCSLQLSRRWSNWHLLYTRRGCLNQVLCCPYGVTGFLFVCLFVLESNHFQGELLQRK